MEALPIKTHMLCCKEIPLLSNNLVYKNTMKTLSNLSGSEEWVMWVQGSCLSHHTRGQWVKEEKRRINDGTAWPSFIPVIYPIVLSQLSIKACPNTWLPKTLTSVQLQPIIAELCPAMVTYSPSNYSPQYKNIKLFLFLVLSKLIQKLVIALGWNN